MLRHARDRFGHLARGPADARAVEQDDLATRRKLRSRDRRIPVVKRSRKMLKAQQRGSRATSKRR